MNSSLYPWQLHEIEHYGNIRKRNLFADPRLGKTRVAALLLQTWGVDLSLVCAPLSVCPAWVKELRGLGMVVIEAYKGSVAKVAASLTKGTWGVIVVNDDRLAGLEKVLLKLAPQAIIGDESHRFRGVSTKKAKSFRKLCWQAEYVRLMSGTPAPNHLGNLWGQLVCLDKEAWGSFKSFSDRYLLCDTMFRSKVIGAVNTEELMARVRACSSIIRRKDVFGPDTWQTVVRDVELPTLARKIYTNLANKWLHEQSEQETISTNHVLTRLLRMQQIASGVVRWDDGTLQTIHGAKIDAVLADLEEIVATGEKAVIFHKFSWEATAYANAIQTRLRIRPLMLNGSTSAAKRQETIDAINTSPNAQIAIVQTQAGGTGISLAGATHALVVSQLFNFDDEQQARDRIFKPGESRCITYYRATRTIDQYIASVLAQKQSVHESVVATNLKEALYA